MDPVSAAKLLSEFRKNATNLNNLLVEYLQERNLKVPLPLKIRKNVIARQLTNVLENIHVDMTPPQQEEIVKCVRKNLFKEETLIAADVIITAASAREATRASQRRQQLREDSGLSRAKLVVMQDIHRARSEGRNMTRFVNDRYEDQEEVAKLGAWLEKLGYEVEKDQEGYTVQWNDESDEEV
jgi:hypothetical protein